MPGPSYDMEAMIANIKRRCSVPASQLTYTDEDFTLLCTDELQGEVVPLVMSAREEYFVDHIDVTLDSDGTLDIPSDAVGAKLRSVCYLQQANPIVLINLPRIDLDVVAGIGFASWYNLYGSGFYIEGNKLKIYPGNSLPQSVS